MFNQRKNTLQSHPSLLPLRMALILAESESPARPSCVDVHERYALQLIARMQAEYKKVLPFLNVLDVPEAQGFSENYQEMAAGHAR
jgi:uncharacterized protein YbgA (DUF1722 family)